MTPKYWPQALTTLKNADPILAKLIAQYKEEGLKARGDAFQTLLRAIVGQQVSVKAADAVWRKLSSKVEAIDPKSIRSLHFATFRSAGFSRQKISYARDLGDKFLDGTLEQERWADLGDEELIKNLCRVKGIGRWTAEMFLIFHLQRPNVLPLGDLGLHKAIAKAYEKRFPISERTLKKISDAWHPYRTVATWYLWRSLDPIPVEY